MIGFVSALLALASLADASPRGLIDVLSTTNDKKGE
jgi:hypothetical protein